MYDTNIHTHVYVYLCSLHYNSHFETKTLKTDIFDTMLDMNENTEDI